MTLENRRGLTLAATVGLMLAAVIAGRSIATTPLTMTNPALLMLGALLLLFVLIHPVVGIVLLVVSLWLTPFYPETGSFTLNRMLGLIVLAGIVVPKLRRNNRTFVFTTFDFAFMAFLLTALVSVAVTYSLTFDRFIDTIMSYLLFWQIINVVDDWSKLKAVFVATVLCALGVSVPLILKGIASQGSTVRITLEGNPNTYAGLFLLGAILLIWLADHVRSMTQSLLYTLVLPLIIGIFFTGNRSAIISLGFAVLAYAIFSLRRTSGIKNAVVISAIIVGAFYFASLYVPTIAQRSLDFASQGEENATDNIRGDLLRISLRIIADHPVLGVGFGNGPDYMAIYIGDRVSVHNLFLGVAVETGLIGLVILMFMYFVVMRDLFDIWTAEPTRGDLAFKMGNRDAFHAMVLILSYNIIPFLTHGLSPSRPWFAIFAFVVVTLRIMLYNQIAAEVTGDDVAQASHIDRARLARWSVTDR